jgi:uncharacterized protein (DUF736 family)
MIIGNFSKNGDVFSGKILTLTLNRVVTLIPDMGPGGTDTPDYDVMIDDVEIGAAWKKTSAKGNAYVSLRLDDPTFPAPLYASLLEGKDGNYALVWSRSKA